METNNQRRKLYRLREAAEELGVSESFLRRLSIEGKINVIRIGGAVRISEAELNRIASGGECK